MLQYISLSFLTMRSTRTKRIIHILTLLRTCERALKTCSQESLLQPAVSFPICIQIVCRTLSTLISILTLIPTANQTKCLNNNFRLGCDINGNDLMTIQQFHSPWKWKCVCVCVGRTENRMVQMGNWCLHTVLIINLRVYAFGVRCVCVLFVAVQLSYSVYLQDWFVAAERWLY